MGQHALYHDSSATNKNIGVCISVMTVTMKIKFANRSNDSPAKARSTLINSILCFLYPI